MIEELLTRVETAYIVTGAMIITQLLKGFVKERFFPAISFALAFVLTLVVFGFTTVNILPAIIVGGAGSGIYDLVKKTILNK